MHEPIRQRCIQLANLLIETNKTVRALAEQTGYSKSTIHKDLTERLPIFSEQLALQVKFILEQHKATRHLRGGEATRMKWAKMKDPNEDEQQVLYYDGDQQQSEQSVNESTLNKTANELQQQATPEKITDVEALQIQQDSLTELRTMNKNRNEIEVTQ